MKNIKIILFLSSLIIFIFACKIIYDQNKNDFNNEIKENLNKKAFTINEYFTISKSSLFTLKNSFEENLTIFSKNDYFHPNFYKMTFNFKKDTYYNKLLINKNKKQYASINGISSNFSALTNKQINTLLFLNPIFSTIIDSIHDIKWVYYTSIDKFIYLSPTTMKEDKKFILALYTKEFWTQAIPQINLDYDLIITSIYEDLAHKGLMTTLSLPVKFENEFIGIFSIDIGLDTLEILIKDRIKNGEVTLLKANNEILASSEFFNFEKNLIQKIDSTKVYTSHSFFNNKLKLVHSIDKNEKVVVILKNSVSSFLILLFLILVINIVIYLIFLNMKIRILSNIDPLTSLLNRRAMENEIITLIEISKRYEQSISFLMLDIDNFKKVNDTYGHQVGDETLKAISLVLKTHSRKADLVSRYGGEEFLICLANTKIDEAYILAERIRIDVKKLKIKKITSPITISIGCAEYKKSENFEKTIDRADKLLYEAKANGKNQTKKE